MGGITDYHGRSGGYLDFSPLRKLRHLEIMSADLHDPVKIPASLETLCASANFVGPTLFFTDTPENTFPALQSLDLTYSASEERYLHGEDQQIIEGIEDTEWVERTNFFDQVARTNNGTLRNLYVGEIYNDHELDSIISTGIFQSVTHLQLNLKFRQFADDIADRFISGTPNLETLDISCSELDGYQIRYLVKGSKTLKYIDFSLCQFSGPFIQEWLRKRNIKFRARPQPSGINYLLSARHGD